MLEKEKTKTEELEKVAGGKFVRTTCYKCGKEITLHVADFPMDGYPAPICADCAARERNEFGVPKETPDLVKKMNGK